MKILVIDNYDSFVYNLVHILHELNVDDITVVKNDAFKLSELEGYSHILLSPGPGVPNQAGLMKEVVKNYGSSKNILGVCLGHQAIAEVYGGKLINLKMPLHGYQSSISLFDDEIFKGLGSTAEVGHYHSWVVDPNLPPELEIIAEDVLGNVMAIRHRKYAVKGLQFHPESIMTRNGKEMISNWLNGSI